MDSGKKKGNQYAIISIIVGVISLVIPVLIGAIIFGFIGIILGAKAYTKKQKIGGAIGVILGLISVLFGIYAYSVLLSAGSF
jgi:hypothetical protein